MPGVVEGIYAQYHDSVIKMAKKPGGVSRPEIMKGLSVTRPAADKLIDECRLKRARTEGRTNFFTPTKATSKVQGSELEDQNPGEDVSMIDQPTQDQADQALLTALVTDDPAPQQAKPKNRLPTEPPVKSAVDLDTEIKAIRSAIGEAEEKAKNAHTTFVVQQAHANALGTKLQRVLEARLSL